MKSMAAIMTLLQSLQPRTPQLFEEDHPDFWSFKSKLLDEMKPVTASDESVTTEDQGEVFFRPFINDYEHLVVMYALNCSLIAKFLQSRQKLDKTDHAFKEHLINALALANLLHVINSQYLNSPAECQRLEKQELVLRMLLREYGYKFVLIRDLDIAENDDEAYMSENKPFSKWIRELTANTNWPRLLIVRIKRVLDTLIPLIKGLPGLVHTIQFIDQIANPIFAYLAWIFYVPRLTINLFVLLKNVIPHPWMSKRQQQLGYLLRIKSQLNDKWFELGNDGVWLTVGLINCFILIGSLQPWAIYLTVTLYAFDIALACTRAFIELHKLHQIQDTLCELSKDSQYSKQIDTYLVELDKRILYEAERLSLSIVTTLGLFVGMLSTIPFIAFSPYVPLIGASFIVLLCVSTFWVGKEIEKNKQEISLPTLEDAKLLQAFKERQILFGKTKSVESIHLNTSWHKTESKTSQHDSKLDEQDKKPEFDQWRFHKSAVAPTGRISKTPPPPHHQSYFEFAN